MTRLSHSIHGLVCAYQGEISFRTQLVFGVSASLFTIWLSPSLIWWAIVIVMIAAVLAAELINTALENALDGLHPAQASFVKIAKDCAAGAVLVVSVASALVFALMVIDTLGL